MWSCVCSDQWISLIKIIQTKFCIPMSNHPIMEDFPISLIYTKKDSVQAPCIAKHEVKYVYIGLDSCIEYIINGYQLNK